MESAGNGTRTSFPGGLMLADTPAWCVTEVPDVIYRALQSCCRTRRRFLVHTGSFDDCGRVASVEEPALSEVIRTLLGILYTISYLPREVS